MNSTSTKVAAVAVGLISTWATAQADDFIVSVTPNAGQTLDNVQVFSARTSTDTMTNPGTTAYTQSDQALTPNLGTVAGGTTFTTTVSTSYGTSIDSPISDGTDATFGLLATSNGFAVLGGSISTMGTTYAAQYGTTNVTLPQALAGIQGNSLRVASALFPTNTSNALYTAKDVTGATSGNFYAFDASGAATTIGTWSVSAAPVPEPATMAALGVGVLGLMRRRRKLA